MRKSTKSKKQADGTPKKMREGSTLKNKLIDVLKKKQLTKAEASKVLYKKQNIGAVLRVMKGVELAAAARLIPGYKLVMKENADGERIYKLAGRAR